VTILKKYLIALLILLSGVTTLSCMTVTENYDVFVTVYPMQYVIGELFKDTDLTVGLVPGISAHNEAIDWSPKEIIAMMDATLLFYVGANFDTYIDNQIGQIFTDSNVELVRIENNLVDYVPGIVHVHEEEPAIEAEPADEDVLGFDPHFWISPKRMLTVTLNTYELLKTTFPDDATTIETNYTALNASLVELDEDYTAILSTATKAVMTSTNLYSYLFADYGLNFIPISPGYHEETEQFTTQQKELIVNEAIEHYIEHIIFERDSSSPLSTAVMTSLISLGYPIVKLEYIVVHSLTIEDAKAGRDFLSIMYDNLAMFQIATGR